mmetsp:Transcript_14566/g.20827  ORF Transcript_14566/g.20827 Transcript_14566/m.20827 type:complete len:113 (+) Transcript_14566:149-487(+)
MHTVIAMNINMIDENQIQLAFSQEAGLSTKTATKAEKKLFEPVLIPLRSSELLMYLESYCPLKTSEDEQPSLVSDELKHSHLGMYVPFEIAALKLQTPLPAQFAGQNISGQA